MAKIELKEIKHSYKSKPVNEEDFALKRIHTVWDDGGAYALLGPSGCGKTTMLNIISGLLKPSHGSILYDGVDVSDMQPEQRNIAQVFQFPVLYDTMTVYENFAFPLKNRGVPKKDIHKRVLEIADISRPDAGPRQTRGRPFGRCKTKDITGTRSWSAATWPRYFSTNRSPSSTPT